MNQLTLPCDPKELEKLDWVGFVADATIAAVFYVDNVKIGPNPAVATKSIRYPRSARLVSGTFRRTEVPFR